MAGFNQVYGVGSSLINVMPVPIYANRAPTSNDTNYVQGQVWYDNSVSPGVAYAYDKPSGTWQVGGNSPATTTDYGVVLLTDNSEPVATKAYADALAIAGSPVATETTAGIGQLATDVEAVAGTPSTGLLALFVTPSNLAPVFAAPPAIGGTTPAAVTATDLVADGTLDLDSTVAAHMTVTGAADLTLNSTAGSVNIAGGEAAADAVSIQASAGGLDVDTALLLSLRSSRDNASAIEVVATAGGIDISASGASAGEDIDIVATGSSVNISSTENTADSITIVSTAGGIDISASGASAGEDIDITATGSSVNITSTENNAGAVIVRANGGTSERVTLLSSQGTGADSINLESTAGGITLAAALATADAINLAASAGGVDIDGALQVNIASSQNAVDAIRIVASAGGIDIDAVGVATEDINITNTGGSVVIVATESVADAIRMNASGAAGGFDIDAGTNGFIVDTTGAISLDAAAASNFTVTGAFDISVITTAGSANITAGEDAADAIVLSAGAGGIDILASGAAGQDIDIVNTGGSVNISATEDNSGAITIGTNGGTSERITVTAAQGTNAASIGLVSTAGGVTITGGLATADAINIVASNAAGGIDIDAGTNGVIVDTTGAVSLDSATASNFTVTGAADLTIQSTAGAVNIISGEANADSLHMTSAGGADLVVVGAAAKDILITNTNGSITLSAGESVTDAMNLTAGGAASGINFTCGTNGINLASGQKVKVTAVVTGVDASPYALLGTDYFLSVDTGAGVMTITLPAAPATGRKVTIYDGGGAAAGSNITIDGNGKNIAAAGTSAATKLINTAYESYNLVYNGTLWLGQNIV